MLQVRQLQCKPVGEAPLENVSFTVSAGELVAVCGPNGAGKSTLCRCLAALYPRQAGEILLDGAPLPSAAWGVARVGLSVLLKGRRVFPELTVEENLAVSPRSWAGGPPQRRLQEVFELFPELAARRRQRGGTLSGGEQQMVAIGRALLSRPRVLVLDEPSLGLAPRVVADLQRAFSAIRASGVALLVAEEDAERLAGIADRSYSMIQGKLTSVDTDRSGPNDLGRSGVCRGTEAGKAVEGASLGSRTEEIGPAVVYVRSRDVS